jgi:hypothetical protein
MKGANNNRGNEKMKLNNKKKTAEDGDRYRKSTATNVWTSKRRI